MRKELDIAIRMKSYEMDHRLNQDQPIIIRLDGRAFHTFTRRMEKPFYEQLHKDLISTATMVAKELQNVIAIYIQSDEISYLLKKRNPESQIFLGGRVDKINSLAASLFTSLFPIEGANFDCRCFNMPAEDVQNYFYWRAMDARRNSINSVAQQFFSAKKLSGKNIAATLEMLTKFGINWEDYPH